MQTRYLHEIQRLNEHAEPTIYTTANTSIKNNSLKYFKFDTSLIYSKC